ncbi:STAS domain-containing protein [Amycolatopsis sp. lyj-112]|uniref:STAS domain-containing protein n=1 Tax=Amycolatopsis sp. lyj-112 TaxID=2789288 RepID=UPI00397C94E8
MTVSPGAAQPGSLSVTTTELEDGVVTVEVRGDIDLTTSPRLHATINEFLRSGPGAVVIDMTGVGFCDSSGLSILVHLNNQCAASDIDLTIAPSRMVRRAIELTGLSSTLTMTHPSTQP